MRPAVERRPALLALVLTAAIAACSDTPTTPPTQAAVASVQVNVPASLQLGHSVLASAAALDATGKVIPGKSFSWSSSNEQYASVDGTGRVTAHAVGDVTITASVDGRSGSAGVQVVPQLARITAILDSLRAAYDMPAIGGAIVTRDSVWAFDAVGRRRASTATAVTKLDRFHLGSNLKAMVGGLVGRLVDEGVLNWDLRLDAALPELAAQMRAEYRDRTLADLLAHTAGLPRDPQIVYTAQDPVAQREQAVTWALQQPPAAGAGVHAYSNIGYMVAGMIAERVAGQPFEELIVSRLFAPLGITSAGFGAMGTPGMEDQPWQHYINQSNQRVEVAPSPSADNPPSYGPAGRAHMSVPDWARYIQALLRAEHGATDIWSQATALKLTAPHVVIGGGDGYAMGWVTTSRTWAGGRVLAHTGTNTMNYSAAWLAPDAGFGVIVVANQGGNQAATATDQAAGRLIGLFLNGN